MVHPDRRVAQLRQELVGVRGEHEDAGLGHQGGEPLAGLRHECGVHRADPLVEQQDLRLDGGHHTEGEAHAHTGGVGAQRHGEVVAELTELGDVVHLLLHGALGLAEEQAADDDVLVAGDLRVHAHTQVEHGGDAALDHGGTAGRLVDAGEQPQQGGLAGAVVADQSDAVALLEVDVDVAEGLDDDGVVLVATDGAAGGAEEGLLQGAGLRVEDGEVHAGVVGVDRNQGDSP